MNMKMEDAQARKKGEKVKEDDNESAVSNANEESFHADYDKMLVKYEASVRNHIKIEQQLKLHIECVQDKLDENDKIFAKQAKVDNDKEQEIKAAQQKLKE